MKTSSFLLNAGVVLSIAAASTDAAAQGLRINKPQEGQPSANASGGLRVNAGQAGQEEPEPAPGTPEEKEWAERERHLNEAPTLTGGVGLLHTQHAQGGAPGQFRVDFTTEWFSQAFLCTREFPCPDPQGTSNVLTSESGHNHIGGRLRLSAQVLKWLDAYMATSATANSNPANRPSLLQVLGDSVIGGKAHGQLSRVFHAGGAMELWLVNGTGSVGLDGGGTSFKFRGLATADLRDAEKRVPLRFSTNLTYVLDNSGEVVTRTEANRGTPITRIERFGLNINRTDHLDIHLGAELFAAEEKVRPFLEYQILIPINRQDYRCRQDNPSGDKCLALDPFAPSTLTLGSRFYPWKKGFSLTAAFDIGISGVGFFIEEMRPTPPWMFYLGAGWAFDTQDKPPVVRERIVTQPVAAPTGRKIRGFVHEEGHSEGIAGAIVAWENHPELTSLATGEGGRFTTHALQPGPYAFAIHAEGYKPGQCSTTIGGSEPPPAAPPPAAPGAPAAPPPQPAPDGGGDVQLDCVVQALPRVGTIVGKVKDLDTGAFVSGAVLKVVDVAKKELSGSTDPQGAFRFEQVTPGESTITVDADGYLASAEKLDVKVRQDNPIEISLKKKPKNALVTVGAREINIKQQVQFAVNSATILPASNALLAEIADVLLKNPRIKRVEVQGHTDNSGTPALNQKLSDDRASAVVAWLTTHGIAPERLSAKGYGDSKPLVPNVTELNKSRNRRVQFIIQEQDPAPANPYGAPALGSGAAPKR